MVSIVGVDETIYKQKTCKNCASILKYTESEQRTGTCKDYGGGSDSWCYIVCPKCNNEVMTRNY